MKLKKLKIALLPVLIVSININAIAAGQNPERPFANRIIFSETPETGKKWHGGVRMKDILCWDGYWNVGGWFTLDLLAYGISLNIDSTDNGDALTIADKFRLFSVKSRPLQFDLFNHPYKIGIGFEAYRTVFNLSSSAGGPADFNLDYQQGGLFVVQSWFLENQEWWIFRGSHYINLVASFAAHEISENKNLTSWYFIPGYRYFFNRPARLSFDLEFYYMNPYEFPVKLLQIAVDPDMMPYENPEMGFATFMFWGFSYSWKHLRLEAHIGHHPTFAGLVLPIIGAGWNF